jgi:hypothetical protein
LWDAWWDRRYILWMKGRKGRGMFTVVIMLLQRKEIEQIYAVDHRL